MPLVRALARLSVVLALALPAPAFAGPVVVLYPAIGRPTFVWVSGRVLRAGAEGRKGAPPLEKNVRRLTAKSLEHVGVEVGFGEQVRRTTTGDDGEFEVSFPAPADHPFPLGQQPVRAAAEGASAQSRVEIVSDAAPFIVVSDFDDTVAVSNVQNTGKMLHAAMLEDEATQPVVAGMAEFFRCLRAASDPPPGFAFVTGSPVEYGARIEALLARGGFPFAALHLRRLGPKTLSGYKEPVLRRLLSVLPQRFVLVGDSGERDPEVYARIRAEFPGRVAAIFIRDVGRSSDPARFRDMVLFRSAGDAAREGAARGLLPPACLQAAFGG